MEKRKRFNSSHVLVLLLAVISFIILYGIDVLDVTNDTWLLASERFESTLYRLEVFQTVDRGISRSDLWII